MMPSLLRAQEIRHAFVSSDARHEVLNGVSLVVQRGEVVALEGPSGSGKSTLLAILGGLCRFDSGELHWLERRVDNLTERKLSSTRRGFVGFLFQEDSLIHALDVEENIDLACRLARAKPTRTPLELLRAVGLEERRRHRVGELSGGEEQRAALARALAIEPRLLIADEPTAHLDRTGSREIVALMTRLCRDNDIGCVMATHDPDVAGQADRCLSLRDGRFS